MRTRKNPSSRLKILIKKVGKDNFLTRIKEIAMVVLDALEKKKFPQKKCFIYRLNKYKKKL